MNSRSNRTRHKGWHSRGYLPHFDSPEVVQHIVFRMADSLPGAAFEALPDDAPLRLQRLDAELDLGRGAALLKQADVAAIVQTALLHFDGRRYRLLAWSVMPNHVHALVEPAQGSRLGEIVHSWKSFTAHEINGLLRREGSFWAADYFDRFVRDEDHFHQTVDYVEQNAVKAGLAVEPSEWRFSSAAARRAQS